MDVARGLVVSAGVGVGSVTPTLICLKSELNEEAIKAKMVKNIFTAILYLGYCFLGADKRINDKSETYDHNNPVSRTPDLDCNYNRGTKKSD